MMETRRNLPVASLLVEALSALRANPSPAIHFRAVVRKETVN